MLARGIPSEPNLASKPERRGVSWCDGLTMCTGQVAIEAEVHSTLLDYTVWGPKCRQHKGLCRLLQREGRAIEVIAKEQGQVAHGRRRWLLADRSPIIGQNDSISFWLRGNGARDRSKTKEKRIPNDECNGCTTGDRQHARRRRAPRRLTHCPFPHSGLLVP
jgi:hypothetical protein